MIMTFLDVRFGCHPHVEVDRNCQNFVVAFVSILESFFYDFVFALHVQDFATRLRTGIMNTRMVKRTSLHFIGGVGAQL